MNKSQALYFNIVLPAEYKLEKKVKNRLDKFANKLNNSKIMKWIGDHYVGKLFYIYLLNKYKSRCLIRTKTPTIDRLGILLDISVKDLSKSENIIIDDAVKQLSNCIRRGIETIIIPVSLFLGGFSSHANVLIYRKNNNSIEHFEPHGSNLIIKNGEFYQSVLDSRLQIFMDRLNTILKKYGLTEVGFEPAFHVCPSKKGLQALDNEIEDTFLDNGEIESYGYCLAWSMFFTELVLQNPKFTSQELLTLIFKSSQLKPAYIKKLIRGYVLNISEKLETYFTVFFGPNTNLKNIYKVAMGNEDLIVEMRKYMDKFIDIEMLLLNDHFDKETYKRNLEDEIISIQKLQGHTSIFSRVYANFFSKQNKAPPTLDKPTKLDKDLEALNIQKKILENIHIIENANESAKLNSPLKPIDIKELLKCPDGNDRDPYTGKCIKPKNKTKKERVQKEPEQKEPEQKEPEQKEPAQKEPAQKEPEQKKPRVQKECKEGKVRNVKGRCVNPQNKTKKASPVKKEKECKEGKVRNVKGRCVNPQNKTKKASPVKKEKECKEGKVQNDKGRCVKIKL